MKKQREQYAAIEFVALHPLDECVFQLRDARSAAIEPTFEREDARTYKFKIRKLRRDRYGRDFAMVTANVYLKGVSEGETAVVGSIRFAWSVILGTVVFGVVLVASLVMREWWLTLVVALVTLSYWAFVWWDRQSLIGLVKRRLGEEAGIKERS